MLTILKGLPLSYFKDLQDDKELVFNSFDQLKNSLIILKKGLRKSQRVSMLVNIL